MLDFVIDYVAPIFVTIMMLFMSFLAFIFIKTGIEYDFDFTRMNSCTCEIVKEEYEK